MMLLGSYAVTLVHMFSGGLVMLLNGADLAAKRGVDLHVAKREELLLGKCCCFSDDSSLCAAASGAAVVIFDVLAHASPQAKPTCTELGTVTLGAEATHTALGPSVAGGATSQLGELTQLTPRTVEVMQASEREAAALDQLGALFALPQRELRAILERRQWDVDAAASELIELGLHF